MKFRELQESTYPDYPIFAWFEPARGPEDMPGVRLAYIDSIEKRYQHNLAQATADNDQRRLDNINRMRERAGTQRYYTPHFDWWMSEKDFMNNEKGFSGTTFVGLEDKYPNLQIMHSKEAAIKAAEEAGVI